ncbi:MAG TPA: hypothetical protein VJH71_03125 [Candidatus Paceibacterota bacterium]
MTNIDKLALHVTKYGEKGILIHTIPKTSNWLVCQKINANEWVITLLNPMGNVTYNLGTITTEQHLNLWQELTRLEIEERVSQIKMAKELKKGIN